MTDEVPETHDFSRVDTYMAARRRAMVLHALWKPLLAGAALVISAVWITLPKVSYREIVVDHVVQKDVTIDHVVPRDVTVDHIVPKDVEVEVPRFLASSPEARMPDERRFVETPAWQGAIVRGRILRQDGAGFILATDDGEQGFYPATINAAGKPELDPSAEDIVAPYIGDLARCNKLPIGTFECRALHEGQEVFIRQTPINRPRRATEGPHALAGWLKGAGHEPYAPGAHRAPGRSGLARPGRFGRPA